MKKSNARVREAQSFCWGGILAITGSLGYIFSNAYLEMLSELFIHHSNTSMKAHYRVKWIVGAAVPLTHKALFVMNL